MAFIIFWGSSPCFFKVRLLEQMLQPFFSTQTLFSVLSIHSYKLKSIPATSLYFLSCFLHLCHSRKLHKLKMPEEELHGNFPQLILFGGLDTSPFSKTVPAALKKWTLFTRGLYIMCEEPKFYQTQSIFPNIQKVNAVVLFRYLCSVNLKIQDIRSD